MKKNETKTKLKNCFPTKTRKTFVKLCNLLTLIHAVRYEPPNSFSFYGQNVFVTWFILTLVFDNGFFFFLLLLLLY